MLGEGDECWARETSVGERLVSGEGDECWMREVSVG